MGVKTDVIKIGKLIGKSSFNVGKIRPLEGGYDVSADTEKLGTLGCIVTNVINGERQFYILSNNHILGDENRIPIGAPIYQPSVYYTSKLHKEEIGILSNFIPIKYGSIPLFLKTNYMDCAIARVTNKNLVSNKITFIGEITGVGTPVLGSIIKKIGATTSLTEGTITSSNSTLITTSSRGKLALYKKQFIAKAQNSSGDSGSAVLNQNNEVVGLFFSGTDNDEFMSFSNINTILKKLKVDIYINQ